MLAIDEGAGVEDARLALEAARAALAQLERERKDLPARHREAVQRGDFASARKAKDEMQLLEDHVAFARGQVQRAEVVLLAAEVDQAQHEATQAGERLAAAIAQEAQAREAHQQATAHMVTTQSAVTSAVLRLEDLQRQHAQASARLSEKGP